MAVDQNQQHFDRIADRYEGAADTWSSLSRQVREQVQPLVRDKVVLDVGNGGFFAYEPRDAREVTAFDISPAMLERIDAPGVRKVVGDARTLEGIERDSVDVLLFVFALHHIVGSNLRDTLDVLDRVLAAAHTRLRRGGRLIVAEPVLRGLLYSLESALFPVTRTALRALKVPMIFFYSRALLADRIRQHFSAESATVQSLEMVVDDPVDPLGGSFPGLISVPSWLRPTDYFLFQCVK